MVDCSNGNLRHGDYSPELSQGHPKDGLATAPWAIHCRRAGAYLVGALLRLDVEAALHRCSDVDA